MNTGLAMALTIRIFGRWTARSEDGEWMVVVGPRDIAVALNALRGEPMSRLDVDAQRLREARELYSDLEVVS